MRARLQARGLPSTVVALLGGERVTVRALAPDALRKLREQHPPAEGGADDLPWDPVTFTPALLAGCVDFADGGSWSETDWAEQLRAAGAAGDELVRLLDVVYSINGAVAGD